MLNKKVKSIEQVFYDLLKRTKFTKTDRRCIKFFKEIDSNAYYVLIETGENRKYKGFDLVKRVLDFLNSRDNLVFNIIHDTTTECPYAIFEARKSYNTYIIRLIEIGQKYETLEYPKVEEIRDILKYKCPKIHEALLRKEKLNENS